MLHGLLKLLEMPQLYITTLASVDGEKEISNTTTNAIIESSITSNAGYNDRLSSAYTVCRTYCRVCTGYMDSNETNHEKIILISFSFTHTTYCVSLVIMFKYNLV